MSSQICQRIHRPATLCAAILAGFALHAHGADANPPVTPVTAAKPAAATAKSVVTFSVKAGPTRDVLSAIAAQSGAAIHVDPTAAARQTSPAINGTMTVQQAVLRAIDGTGLSLGEEANGALTVAAIQTLDVVHVFAQRDKAETRFKADRSDTATRSGSDLSEIPQSITILTAKVLETQQTRTVLDALKNVSGLSFSQSPQAAPQFQIRALKASVTSNGLADGNAAQGDAFAVERVEVLKGPQAILSGGDSMGGGVNIVTKKPQAEALQSYLLQYGSHGDTTLAADLTGLVADDKRLSYRLIGSAAKARSSEGGYDGRSNYSLTPQLRWKDSATDLILGATVSKSHQAVPRYTFAVDGVILPSPAMKLSADSDGFDATSRKVFYQLEHKLNPDATLVSRLQYTSDKRDQHLRSPAGGLSPGLNDPDVLEATFYGSRSLTREKNFSGDHYLRLNFNTGDIGHKLSLGINHTRIDMRTDQWDGPAATAQVYPAVPVQFIPVRQNAMELTAAGRYPSAQVGAYVQNLMNWGDWNLLLNLRRTRYTTGPTETAFFDGSAPLGDPKTKVTETTPGAGIIYNLNEHVSFYASYQEGFQPEHGLSCQNTLLPPQRSKSKELGAKFDLLDSKLSLTTAAFDMKVSNSLLYNPLEDCYTPRPGTVTRGVEVDLQGELASGLNTILNYTYSKANDPGDPLVLYAGLPRHKVSLWGTYALGSLGLDGWSVGLGVTASSKSEGSSYAFDRFKIPGQAQWDLSINYDSTGWSGTVGVKNLFGKLLYDVSTSSSYVPIKDGRTFMISVKKSFN